MPRPLPFIAVSLLALAWLAVWPSPAGPPKALAVERGANCASYADGVCVIEVGDIWFCSEEFQDSRCTANIVAGDTVRWEYPASGELLHTATECGVTCEVPTDTPLWDSDRLSPGDSFELTFPEPGRYEYYCQLHPLTQRGLIRVIDEATPPDLAGDANCDGSVTSVDSLLILQLVAGLLEALPCADNADVNEDGMTAWVDAALILQRIGGLIPILPT